MENEAKFWINPKIELALIEGFNTKQLNEILEIIKRNENTIREKWNTLLRMLK